MKTVELKVENLIHAYKNGSNEIKTFLNDLVPDVDLCPNIMDRVKSFEDACEVLGLDPVKCLPCIDHCQSEDYAAITAFAKISIIRGALNEGWKPDWANSNEYKYYPWFKHSGVGFSYGDYATSSANSSVGSRLCYKSRELAEYAGKQFIDLYKQFLTL